MTAAWAVNGVDLGSRWVIEGGSLWRPPVTVRRSSVVIPGRHGVIPAGPVVFDEPTVSLTLFAGGATQAEVESFSADLVGLFSVPSLTVTRTSGGVSASAAAQLVSIAPAGFWLGRGARFTVLLALPGVFLRGAVASSSAIPASADVTGVVVDSLTGSTGPITDAIVRVSGPATAITVTDAATGTGLSWTGELAEGEYLYLGAEELVARRSSLPSAWLTSGVWVSGGLDYPVAGPLQLWPVMEGVDPSDRRVKVDVAGWGRSWSTAVVVRAGRSFL